MTSSRTFLTLMHATLVLLWTPTLALAGVVVMTQGRSVLVLDWLLIGVSTVLATMAGATALAMRVNALLMKDPQRPLVRPWLFACAHMLGSWSAGTAGFLLGQAQSMEVWSSLIAVFFMAFGGAKVLEVGAERWLPLVRPKEV